MQYSFNVIACEEGGYVIEYPDLPGCLTQVETIDEIIPMAEDAKRCWMASMWWDKQEIPLPTYS
jgi:antitoxin HicB